MIGSSFTYPDPPYYLFLFISILLGYVTFSNMFVNLDNPIYPILLTLPLQMLAYHVALLKNCDVDKPRNLAKSVTVE